MDAVYPRRAPCARRRTAPVTFAEIKEVDEESAEAESYEECCGEPSARTRPDMLEERLGKQFMEFRRRRSKRDVLPEREAPSATGDGRPPPGRAFIRTGSEPGALHNSTS